MRGGTLKTPASRMRKYVAYCDSCEMPVCAALSHDVPCEDPPNCPDCDGSVDWELFEPNHGGNT